MKTKQLGQAAVEFAVSFGVLIALVLSIPILAKIANANIMSIQALDYAAWRVREGNTNNQELSREVSDRYFGETALIVDDERINDQGASLGTGRDNKQIYQNDSVTVEYNADRSNMSGAQGLAWNNLDRVTNLGMYDKKGTVSINVPLENLDVIPEIASSMVISKSLYVDNQALTARDQAQIQNSMDNFDNVVIPNNGSTQNLFVEPANFAIERLKLISDSALGLLDVLDHHKLKDVKVDHDAVPADRLATFNSQ
uniref:TadE/TadG family type IV pilus assembly protein n=1 Tax=uncultured Psychrobacter sp. TaxID=259303 RepID=UPI00262ED225|nr:hypothetical protein [uncultured Psychrobacter sp.]